MRLNTVPPMSSFSCVSSVAGAGFGCVGGVGACGDASALPAPGEYRDFLAWLATRDREASLAAWRNAFAGLDEPSLLAAGEGDGSVASAATSRCASAGLTADLSGLARDLGVTMNTLVQAAWGVVM